MTDVVLPCLNEAPALARLLPRLPAGYRPIVADNGSTDGSAELARRLGARVVAVPQTGYGAAVHAGVLAADPADGVVCVMDADGSFDPGDLPLVADPVRNGSAHLMVGRRRPVHSGVWPLAARAGWIVTEVDVAYHPRTAGTKSKVTGTLRGTARAIHDMSAVLAR